MKAEQMRAIQSPEVHTITIATGSRAGQRAIALTVFARDDSVSPVGRYALPLEDAEKFLARLTKVVTTARAKEEAGK
jgi:hypothetical protein